MLYKQLQQQVQIAQKICALANNEYWIPNNRAPVCNILVSLQIFTPISESTQRRWEIGRVSYVISCPYRQGVDCDRLPDGQTVRPSRICLYLSDDEFPNGRASLPRRLLNYERLGLEIYFRPYNLMPHNKYFYALQEYSSCDVITVDDDFYYFPDTIERLTRMHEIHPFCVCSNSVYVVEFRPDGLPLPYNQWLSPISPVEPSLTNVALGYSGIYYPAGIFKKQSVFDIDNIQILALRTDDLWLRMHETLERVPVVGGGYRFMGLSIWGTQRIALKHSNCSNKENNGNDVAWKGLCNHYNVIWNISKNNDD